MSEDRTSYDAAGPQEQAQAGGGGLVDELRAESQYIHDCLTKCDINRGQQNGLQRAERIAARHEQAWQAERAAVRNLLAVIFRDGGHEAASRADLQAACLYAQSCVIGYLSDANDLRDLHQDYAALVDALRQEHAALQSDHTLLVDTLRWIVKDLQSKADKLTAARLNALLPPAAPGPSLSSPTADVTKTEMTIQLTDTERKAIDELATAQELSPQRVMIQALRLYQLVQKGHSKVVDLHPLGMLAFDANSLPLLSSSPAAIGGGDDGVASGVEE